MRRLLPLLLLLTAASHDPRPKLAVTVSRSATLVWVRWAVNAPGSVDFVAVTVTVTGQADVVRSYLNPNKVDSVSYPAPPMGQTISGSVTPVSSRRGLTTAGVAVPWSYTEADQPPPIPDVKVDVIPVSATVAPGGSVGFSATVYPSGTPTWRVLRHGVRL